MEPAAAPRRPQPPGDSPGTADKPGTPRPVSKDDFAAIGARVRPAVRGRGHQQRRRSAPASSVASSWSASTPGPVTPRHRRQPRPCRRRQGLDLRQQVRLDVEFKLLEDPQAKLAAFIKGDIDIMWDTVDSWSREASALAEQGKGKAILQAGLVARWRRHRLAAGIKSIEDLKGQKIATTRFTPSHWLLLCTCCRSRV